jgi:hypothetical protein
MAMVLFDFLLVAIFVHRQGSALLLPLRDLTFPRTKLDYHPCDNSHRGMLDLWLTFGSVCPNRQGECN